MKFPKFSWRPHLASGADPVERGPEADDEESRLNRLVRRTQPAEGERPATARETKVKRIFKPSA